MCAAVTVGMVIIAMFKSVARIRLVKTENHSVCVTVKCKVCRSAIALNYLQLRIECINVITPVNLSKLRPIVTGLLCDYINLVTKSERM
jgi:hypothetical protein